MNCGKNERKNKATLGLRTFVIMPVLKSFQLEFSFFSTLEKSKELFFERSAFTPKYIKYAAPKYFIKENAIADFAKIIESPNDAKIVWTSIPQHIPIDAYIPDLVPLLNDLLITNTVSIPGVIIKILAEIINK